MQARILLRRGVCNKIVSINYYVNDANYGVRWIGKDGVEGTLKDLIKFLRMRKITDYKFMYGGITDKL